MPSRTTIAPFDPATRLLKVPEVAAQLGLSLANTYRLVRSGEIPSIKYGRAIRVPLAAFHAYLQRKLSQSV